MRTLQSTKINKDRKTIKSEPQILKVIGEQINTVQTTYQCIYCGITIHTLTINLNNLNKKLFNYFVIVFNTIDCFSDIKTLGYVLTNVTHLLLIFFI